MGPAARGGAHAGPSDVRHGEIDPELRHSPGEQPEPRHAGGFFALLEKQLEAEADTQHRLAAPCRLGERLAEAGLDEALAEAGAK
jgi:hypothetical protein